MKIDWIEVIVGAIVILFTILCAGVFCVLGVLVFLFVLMLRICFWAIVAVIAILVALRILGIDIEAFL